MYVDVHVPNWVKDKLAHRQLQHTFSTDRLVLAQTLPKLPTTTVILPGTGTPTVVDSSSRLQGPKY